MIPEMRIGAPSCLSDFSWLLAKAVQEGGPWAIRYPRGSGPEKLNAPLTKEGLRWHQKAKTPKLIVVALGATTPRVEAALKEVALFEDEITLFRA